MSPIEDVFREQRDEISCIEGRSVCRRVGFFVDERSIGMVMNMKWVTSCSWFLMSDIVSGNG